MKANGPAILSESPLEQTGSGDSQDREYVHAKSSTDDAQVTCPISRRLQRRPTVVAQRDGKTKEVVSKANWPQEEGTSWWVGSKER